MVTSVCRLSKPASFSGVRTFLFATTLCFVSNAARADLPSDYQSLKADQKREILWKNITAKSYDLESLRPEEPSAWEKSKLLFRYYLLPTFSNDSDELPAGRKKLIHGFGSVARVRWIPSDQNTYTGLFQTGAVGLLRVSLASLAPVGSPYIPGMAIKLFVDDAKSVNFQVMYALPGQGDNRNFFQNTFSNVIPAPTGLLAVAAIGFNRAASYFGLEDATTLTVAEAAHITSAGETLKEYKTPYKLNFVPTLAAQSIISSDDTRDVRQQFANDKFAPGLALYNIYALEKGASDKEKIALGQLILDSNPENGPSFVPGQYGDESLFFEHQRPVVVTP